MFREYIRANTDFLYRVHRELCGIPAPSHHEEKRAAYCEALLRSFGLSAYTDEAKNVICPIGCEGSDRITVFVAHTDTVFPDTEPMPYREEDGKVFCPGAADDTASVAVLLLCAKYIAEGRYRPKEGLLLVCNSCEEGLGNLKGTRAVMQAFAGRVKQFISIDSDMSKIADRCVGSHRYRVEVKTPGGHSFGAFGNKNAIAEAARIINKIYAIEPPRLAGSKTTYNVGTIEGGTSVNTIAQSASFLCEYRSDNVTCLHTMQQKFQTIFREAVAEDVAVEATLIAERPCAADGIEGAVDALSALCRRIAGGILGEEPIRVSSSTDCNIPLSLGIPAVCIGAYRGGGEHTREEWIEKEGLMIGSEIALQTIEALV